MHSQGKAGCLSHLPCTTVQKDLCPLEPCLCLDLIHCLEDCLHQPSLLLLLEIVVICRLVTYPLRAWKHVFFRCVHVLSKEQACMLWCRGRLCQHSPSGRSGACHADLTGLLQHRSAGASRAERGPQSGGCLYHTAPSLQLCLPEHNHTGSIISFLSKTEIYWRVHNKHACDRATHTPVS